MLSKESFQHLLNLESKLFNTNDLMNIGDDILYEIEENENSKINRFSKRLINSYQSYSATRLNRILREGQISKNWEYGALFESNLNQVLDFLEPYNGQIVYRWNDQLPLEATSFLKEHVGKKVLFPQFLSTSKYPKEKCDTMFKIQTNQDSNARYIGYLLPQHVNTEQEVLFKSKTAFAVLGFTDNIVQLIETSNEGAHLLLSENYWSI